MPWYDLGAIVPCLDSCTELRELKLILDCSLPTSSDWHTPSLTWRNARQLRKLYLSSTPRSSGNIAQSHFPLIMQFFARHDVLHDLEELRLGLEDELVSISTVVMLLQTIKKLKVLHITRFENGQTKPLNGEKVLLDHLHTLVISDHADLLYLDAPNLACLECTDIALESHHLPICWATSLESITASGSALCEWNDTLSGGGNDRVLPRLLRLRLTPAELTRRPLAPVDFVNLRTIHFDEGISFTSPLVGGCRLNHFMLEILFSPSNCPNLHTIRSDTYPNWALATATFHRRNSNKSVNPIVSFWLHGQPHVPILTIITNALEAGEEDPANSIAIAAGIDRILRRRWARNIDFYRQQARQHCIMAGYITCALVQETPKCAEPPDNPEVTDLLDLYPSEGHIKQFNAFSRDEWVNHLQNTSLSLDYAIKRTCGRHDSLHPVHIGSNALDETSYDAF